MDWLREEVLDPDTPLFMIGFSLGAGILVKYLSEESTRAIGKGRLLLPWHIMVGP